MRALARGVFEVTAWGGFIEGLEHGEGIEFGHLDREGDDTFPLADRLGPR